MRLTAHIRLVARLTGAPVLAVIPRKREERVTEAFRTLRSTVDLIRSNPTVRTLAVIGAEPGSGSSFVAFGLAQGAANLKMDVVLVDANLRRPALATELRLPVRPGLVEAVREGTIDRAALPQANPLQKGFRVLPAGEEVADPPGMLGSGALRQTLDQLHDAALVVVDSPAAGEAIDALAIASQCDAAVLVIDARRARRRLIKRAILHLSQANVELLGTVINRVEAPPTSGSPK